MDKLSQGPVSVSHLATPLAITLAAVVQHLQILEECGLVHTQKASRVRTCHIDPAGLSVAEEWIGERRSVWERRFDKLGDFLGNEEYRGSSTRR